MLDPLPGPRSQFTFHSWASVLKEGEGRCEWGQWSPLDRHREDVKGMPFMKRLFLGKVSCWMEREQRAGWRQVRRAERSALKT